jgi:hypothetical protein
MEQPTPVYKPLIISELNPPMNVTLVTDGSGLESRAFWPVYAIH